MNRHALGTTSKLNRAFHGGSHSYVPLVETAASADTFSSGEGGST